MSTVIKTKGQAHATPHVEGVTFLCGDCEEIKPVQTPGGTGYAYYEDGPEAKLVCYECCGKRDRRKMMDTGKATLYLKTQANGQCEVVNWPGTLRIRGGYRKGRHNMAGSRYDVWFPLEGHWWHGVTYGDNTQLCHCKRTKEKA